MYSEETIAAMEDSPPDAMYLQKVSAADFREPVIAINEFLANAAQTICKEFSKPNPSHASEKPKIHLKIDLRKRELECVDNGTGMTPAEVKLAVCPGGTGHAADLADGGVGPGGCDTPDAVDSFSTFQISAYGHGGKGAGAGLLIGKNGITSEGSIRVRSRPAGSAGVNGRRRDFAFMSEMKASGRDADVWKTFKEPPEMEPCELELVGKPTFGPRFTRVIINGLNEKLCASLAESALERRKLVACLHELYYPILHGSINGIEWTKPPGGVKLVICVDFILPADADGAAGREQHVLDDAPGPAEPDAYVIPRELGEHPTTALLLARNARRVAADSEWQRDIICAAQKAWGDSLTFHCKVKLELPDNGGSIEAGLLLTYLPEDYEEQLPPKLDFGGGSAGLFPVVNGQRLLAQQPIRPHFLTERPRGRGAALTLADSHASRVFGFIFFGNSLPFLVALDKPKTSFQQPFVEMVERLDPAQIPTDVNWTPPAQTPAPAAPRAAAAETRLRKRPSNAQQLTLEQLIKGKWLADMTRRDAGVRVSDGESSAATQLTVAEAAQAAPPLSARAPPAAGETLVFSDDWTLPQLTFMGTVLNACKPDGLYVQYRSSGGGGPARVVGKVRARRAPAARGGGGEPCLRAAADAPRPLPRHPPCLRFPARVAGACLHLPRQRARPLDDQPRALRRDHPARDL
jgi:hypothetical protein